MYYSSGNYEAFATPKKPEGIENKYAHIVGTGLAGLAAACFLIRDAQMLLNDPAAYERMATAASPYGDGHAAEHIADAIIEHFKNA